MARGVFFTFAKPPTCEVTMRKATTFALVIAGLSAGSARAQIVAADFGVGPVRKWEYRVLGKEHPVTLATRDDLACWTRQAEK